MQRLWQRHSDKSQSVIELRNSKWQIQLTIIRASSICLVGSQAVTLGEAQNVAVKAMKKQNIGHSCTEDCLAWEKFKLFSKNQLTVTHKLIQNFIKYKINY